MNDPLGWRDYKSDPPYNWTTVKDAAPGLESDPDVGFIVYRYTHRPAHGPMDVFVSPYPYPFKDGAFEGYRSHMVTSPYHEDWIEVLAWLSIKDMETYLLSTGREFLRARP